MPRHVVLAGFASFVLMAAPAMAGTSGLAGGSVPGLSGTSVATATNLAAGIGNTARQRVATRQGGGGVSPFGPLAGAPSLISTPLISTPLISTNVATATNVAAGINNTAQQRVSGLQGAGAPNGVRIGLGNGRSSPLVATDVELATNVAAGLGNLAQQRMLSGQH